MKLHLCDLCKSHIPDDSDIHVTVIVTDHRVEQPMYSVGPAGQQKQLDLCVDCSCKTGIIKYEREATVGVGALTVEEIEQLSRSQQ